MLQKNGLSLGSSPSQQPQLGTRDLLALLPPSFRSLTQCRPQTLRVPPGDPPHAQQGREGSGLAADRAEHFFLLRKQQNITERFVFAWGNDCGVAGKQLVPDS